MKIQTIGRLAGAVTACLLLAGCGSEDGDAGTADGTAGRTVDTSGKQDTALGAVPAEVVQAALAARPDLQIVASEYETRDGREYYDLGGTLPDGAELELDLTRVDGAWTVVEVQRDVAAEQVPDPVRQAVSASNPGWSPTRIIESDQGEGVIIYEFFGLAADGGEAKIEVKWANDEAEILQDEWLH